MAFSSWTGKEAIKIHTLYLYCFWNNFNFNLFWQGMGWGLKGMHQSLPFSPFPFSLFPHFSERAILYNFFGRCKKGVEAFQRRQLAAEALYDGMCWSDGERQRQRQWHRQKWQPMRRMKTRKMMRMLPMPSMVFGL
jgi:hypothetical protein